jgi:imidazolonepropionase-like amidohydrolase
MFSLPDSKALLPWLAVLATSLAAQDLGIKSAPQKQPIVLQNAVLHTVTGGIVLGGSLWFHDGKIGGVHAAGEALRLPAGIEPLVVDLAGKHVFPGMLSPATSLGLIEISAVRQSIDTDETGELSPEAVAAVAVNPDSAAIPVARSNGVLAAAVFPSGGLLPGRASLLQLDGWTNADMAVRADLGPVVAWPAEPRDRGGRRGPRAPQAAVDGDPKEALQKARRRIDDAFAAAASWLAAFTADPAIGVDIRHQALVLALRREQPVLLLADEQEQIESAVSWAIGRQLRAVVVGGHEADRCAALLRRHDVPVIVQGVHRLPARDDLPWDEPFTLPARLAELTVRFCIGTGSDFSNDRNLPYHAATAAAFGLGRDQALAAITIALPTTIERAFIRGREIDLRNKQTELARKYRERYRQLQPK